jgi:gluconate 5-dehydrogenase
MGTELFDLTGKNALVTGAAQGIGFAIARGLARAGARVVINARNPEKLARAVAALTQEGLAVSGCGFDVTQSDQIKEKLQALEQELGRIDILVNNAGIQRRMPLEQFDEAVWREVLDTNLTAVFLVTKQVVQGMIARRAGKVINICSLTSEATRPSVAAYTASKGAVKMLTKSMAVEWAKHNIQANGIGPGFFRTELNTPILNDPKFYEWMCARTPAGRWGEVEDLVGTAVFLASRASDFVNGQVVYVDGGVLAAL